MNDSGMLYLWHKNDLIGAFSDVESNEFERTKTEDKHWWVEIF